MTKSIVVGDPTISISKAELNGCDGHKSNTLTLSSCSWRKPMPCLLTNTHVKHKRQTSHGMSEEVANS